MLINSRACLKKANIFCDDRRTWITRRGFLEEKRVEVTKGLKLFDRAVARLPV
jgi:hypothetical protein